MPDLDPDPDLHPHAGFNGGSTLSAGLHHDQPHHECQRPHVDALDVPCPLMLCLPVCTDQPCTGLP